MGQISKATKAVTFYVQDVLPSLVAKGNVADTITTLEQDVIALENQLFANPETASPTTQATLLSTYYALEILKSGNYVTELTSPTVPAVLPN